MKNEILSHITTECPWRDTLYWYDALDSTNLLAKERAKTGAPHGTVIVARSQTDGRGRIGRSFVSPTGGVYLSVVLRPNCTPDKLMHLTCAAAVAGCRAVEKATGIHADIKWTNDLVCGKRKLGGILTELGLDSMGIVDYAIVGIGINCCQKAADFPAKLQNMITSVGEIADIPCSPAKLTASLIEALYEMNQNLLSEKKATMETYRQRCITLGKEIVILRGEDISYGTALDLDEDGGLLVQFTNGAVRTVTSGEVSVRGMYGYL